MAAHQGRPAASAPVVERPRSLVLPSGVALRVVPTRTDATGRLPLPADVDRAAWWEGGARVGDLFGALVLAAHVDSLAEGIGPVAELLAARPGDLLRVASRTGTETFRVASVRWVPRVSLSRHGDLLSFAGPHRLVVITCGGPFEPRYDGYRDNVVVLAEPVVGAGR